MRIEIFIAMILSSSTLKSQEGWFTQQVPSSVHQLNDVFALNSDIAFAVGDSCKIIKTTDGGKNWRLVHSNDSTKHYLYSVFFIDSLRGWAVGGYDWVEKPTILKTDNCGESWYEQTCDAIFPMYTVFFVNADTGWIAGDSGTILKTIDGGSTWIKKESGTQYNSLKDMYFLNSEIGYIVGTDAGWGHVKYGVILKTSNSGETWTHQTSDNLYSIHFINETKGWIIGGQKLYLTNDGGNNWQIQTIDNFYLNSIFFINENKGWAAGNNIIMYTMDGGYNWTVQFQKEGCSDYLCSIYFIDENTGWAVGNHGSWSTDLWGSILKTNNGGLSYIDNQEIKNLNEFYLSQNYPNPFNCSTTIYFHLPKSTFVNLVIYNLLGRRVTNLINEKLQPGIHYIDCNSSELSSGLYFYRLETPEFIETKRLIIQK